MNTNGCICLSIVLANCLLLTLAAAVADEDAYGSQLQTSDDRHMRISYLEQKLREDLAREETDLLELERALGLTKNMISAKKRQLEIKKRRPYQCLVNIVQCF